MVDLTIKENCVVVLVHMTPKVGYLLSPPNIPEQERMGCWVRPRPVFSQSVSWMGVRRMKFPGALWKRWGSLKPQAGDYFQQTGWARKILQSHVETKVGFLLGFFERALTKNGK